MIDKDDKYADEEEENLTQVRSIIKHLHEDTPAKESKREVVVRPDGSKVVRVTKKRRMVVSKREKQRRGRRQFLYIVLSIIIVLLGLGTFLFLSLSSRSSSSYLLESQAELQKRWGASSLVMEGEGIDGTSFDLSQLVAEFPETSMIKRVELYGMSASLELSGFLSSQLRSDKLEIERAVIVLRNGSQMQMPQQQGEDMWNFRRMTCKNLTVQYADKEDGPVVLKNTEAYLYYPRKNTSSCVVMLSSGSLDIKGWKSVNIKEGKVQISTTGITDLSIHGTTDTSSDIAEQRRTSISFAGQILNGANVAGPYAVEADNMSLADFTRGRFEEVLTARTRAVSHGKISDKATITLAVESDEPVFNGQFHLQGVCLSSFPAMQAITEHLVLEKRRLYNPLSLQRGYVILNTQAESIEATFPDDALVERDLAWVKGNLIINNANELSGALDYGIPMLLARVEYADGRPDPIFQQSGDWAVLSTRVSGMGNLPNDDMAEVEARAAIVRAQENRPRIPFDDLNLDRLAEQYDATGTTQRLPQEGTPAPSESPGKTQEPAFNPFEKTEDPFAPSSVPF